MTFIEQSTDCPATPSDEQGGSRTTPHLRCHCNAMTARAWRMSHGDTPCDGTICRYQREQAETTGKLH